MTEKISRVVARCENPNCGAELKDIGFGMVHFNAGTCATCEMEVCPACGASEMDCHYDGGDYMFWLHTVCPLNPEDLPEGQP